MTRSPAIALALLGILVGTSPGWATGTPHAGGRDAAPRSPEAAARFPQPVRVGDLIGRQVLEDRPNQQVLGRIQAVSRDLEGGVRILVGRTGWLGRDAGQVAVPVESMALLGQFVVLKDVPADRFAALPADTRLPGPLLDAAATIRMGLARN